jgi:hypothetical protein
MVNMKAESILQLIRDNQNLTTKELIKFLETPIIKKFKDRIEYRVLGVLHREDGPAIEYSDGTKIWIRYGKRHREDGPAYDGDEGTSWWINGKRHRTDGPALIYSDGEEEWWINGEDVDPF